MKMLETKLKRLAEESAIQQVEWDRVREEWIAEVGRLYYRVESWMVSWVEKGYLVVRRSTIVLSEENLGDYEIPQLELIAGTESIIFEPVGRNILGALGRIDVYLRGFKSDARKILWVEDVDRKRRWELWRDRHGGPKMRFNQENLERVMNELL